MESVGPRVAGSPQTSPAASAPPTSVAGDCDNLDLAGALQVQVDGVRPQAANESPDQPGATTESPDQPGATDMDPSGKRDEESGQLVQEPVKIHCVAYAIFYLGAFIAHWFGAKRFDVDGDGDFDPEDVEAFLEDYGFLHKISERPKAARAPAKQREAEMKEEANRDGRKEHGTEASSAALRAAGDRYEARSHFHDLLDRDGDGHVGLADLVATQVEGSEAEEDVALRNLETGRVRPWFFMFEIGATVVLWFVFALVRVFKNGEDFLYTQAGLDSVAENTFTLALTNGDCDDLRPQVWRWLSYQFTHVGVSHIGMNTMLNLLLGIPLEGMHGWWRMAIMFNVGVLGGAFCYFVLDSHSHVVGCSGGCYSLIGIHLADLVMNWKQKKFRIPTLFLLTTLIAVDLISVNTSASEGKSNAAHLGGGIAGLCIGVLVCKNMHMEAYEKVVMVVLFVVGTGLTIFSVTWMAAQTAPVQNMFEAIDGESSWCWVRQVFDSRVNPRAYECIRCATKGCIEEYTNYDTVLAVSVDECDSRGYWYSEPQ